MIELILTCVIGTLVGGSVITLWFWRSAWPQRLSPARREA